MLLIETWKQVEDFPDYEVSDLGRVRSTKQGKSRILKPWQPSDPSVYPAVSLCRSGERSNRAVHTLVVRTFIGEPPSPTHEVRHLDGNHLNPRLDNLAWGTRKENAQDRTRHGRTPSGPKHGMYGSPQNGEANGFAKLNDNSVRAIRLLAGQMSSRELASAFGVTQAVIWRIVRRKAWRHLP